MDTISWMEVKSQGQRYLLVSKQISPDDVFTEETCELSFLNIWNSMILCKRAGIELLSPHLNSLSFDSLLFESSIISRRSSYFLYPSHPAPCFITLFLTSADQQIFPPVLRHAIEYGQRPSGWVSPRVGRWQGLHLLASIKPARARGTCFTSYKLAG